MMKVTAMMARTERMTMMTKEIKLVLLTLSQISPVRDPPIFHSRNQSYALAHCSKSVPYSHREGVHMEEHHGKRADGKMAGLAIRQWPNYHHREFLTLWTSV
jgi:hypothetical protein